MNQVYLDIETSGHSEVHDRVVEIAALKIDHKTNIKSLFHCYFTPEKKLDAKICGIINLTNEFLHQCPKFETKVNEFVSFIEDSELFVFNKTFVINFLNSELNRLGKTNIVNSISDLLDFSNDRYPKDRASLDFLFRALNGQSNICKGVINEVFLLPTLFKKIKDFDINQHH